MLAQDSADFCDRLGVALGGMDGTNHKLGSDSLEMRKGLRFQTIRERATNYPNIFDKWLTETARTPGARTSNGPAVLEGQWMTNRDVW